MERIRRLKVEEKSRDTKMINQLHELDGDVETTKETIELGAKIFSHFSK